MLIRCSGANLSLSKKQKHIYEMSKSTQKPLAPAERVRRAKEFDARLFTPKKLENIPFVIPSLEEYSKVHQSAVAPFSHPGRENKWWVGFDVAKYIDEENFNFLDDDKEDYNLEPIGVATADALSDTSAAMAANKNGKQLSYSVNDLRMVEKLPSASAPTIYQRRRRAALASASQFSLNAINDRSSETRSFISGRANLKSRVSQGLHRVSSAMLLAIAPSLKAIEIQIGLHYNDFVREVEVFFLAFRAAHFTKIGWLSNNKVILSLKFTFLFKEKKNYVHAIQFEVPKESCVCFETDKIRRRCGGAEMFDLTDSCKFNYLSNPSDNITAASIRCKLFETSGLQNICYGRYAFGTGGYTSGDSANSQWQSMVLNQQRRVDKWYTFKLQSS